MENAIIGVRQGGILSLGLTTLYVNQLTDKLIACNAGCYFNNMCTNCVMYAAANLENCRMSHV